MVRHGETGFIPIIDALALRAAMPQVSLVLSVRVFRASCCAVEIRRVDATALRAIHEHLFYFLSEGLKTPVRLAGFRAKKSATPKNDAKAIQP
jgi:hypothetical protein